jgi:F0F1-type ATP synthase assembly protein I
MAMFDNSTPEPPQERRRRRAALELAFSVAPLMVCAVGIGYVGGQTLDRWAGIEPVGVSLGVLLGAAAGFVQLFRTARRLAE